MKVKGTNKVHLSPRIDARDITIICGLHYLKISVKCNKDKINYWGNIQRRYVGKKRAEKSMRLRRRDEYRPWRPFKNCRLRFNKNNYITAGFLVDEFSDNEYTDLLPLKHWDEAWLIQQDKLNDKLKSKIFHSKSKLRLSAFELSFDFISDDVELIRNSLTELPANRRYAVKIRVLKKNNSNSTVSRRIQTQSWNKATVVYDREELAGAPVIRLEHRCRHKEAVDTALGLRDDRSGVPKDLSDRDRMDKLVRKMLNNYGIFENTAVRPLQNAIDRFPKGCKNPLLFYNEWEEMGKYRYYVNRVRSKTDSVVGSINNRGEATIENLYEALIQAYNNSWSLL